MLAKFLLALAAISIVFAMTGCDPDKSGNTQVMPEKSKPQTQMPRSADEAKKMFGGGGGNPVAPSSNNAAPKTGN